MPADALSDETPALLAPPGLPMISHGRGVYLYDTHGRRYLDGCSGAVAASLGHGDPGLAEVIAAQVKDVAFAHRSQFRSKPAEELAVSLTGTTPAGLDHAFFCSSGSEAVESAAKLAIRYWQECGQPQKTRVVSRRISYHGSTFGALSATGHPGRRSPYESVLAQLAAFDAPYCYRCPLELEPDSCASACLASLEESLQQMGPGQVAAVLAEPVVGAAGGALVPPAGYHERLRDICDTYDVLWIADEVMSGVGRTGRWFAVEHWDAAPDLIVVGKGLSAGLLPLSAVVCSADVADAVLGTPAGPAIGHTYSNHAVASAAGVAVLDRIRRERLVERTGAAGHLLGEMLSRCAESHAIVGDVRGVGLLKAVELVADRDSRQPFPASELATARLVEACRAVGLLVYPASGGIDGRVGDAVIVAPPLTIEDTEIEELVALFDHALARVSSALKGRATATSTRRVADEPTDATTLNRQYEGDHR